MAESRTGAVTLKGNPVALAGAGLSAGQAAPDFKLQDNGLQEVTLASSAGKTRVIATIPSLDTPTCALETKRFNDEIKNLPNVEVLVVSMDLPFGQKRWCGAEGVSSIKTVSAHRCTKFGEDYGVLIQGGAEILFPLPFIKDQRSIQTTFFVDAGNVFDTDCGATQLNCYGVDIDRINASVGFGLTWISGFGPMTFSIAEPFKENEYDRTEVFQFSLGQTF